MTDSNSFNPYLLFELVEFIRRLIETLPLPLNQRPAFPAIKSPDSGCVITGSQTQAVPLTVSVSTNRPDEAHVVELLNADTFAVLDSEPVSFVTNSAQITIPVVTGAAPTTMMLQCRAPSDAAGNVHRILVNVQAPAIPPPPTVAITATTGSGIVLVSGGTFDHTTTTGLNAVSIAATAAGTGTLSYHWTVTIGFTPIPVAVTTTPLVENLIPTGTTFPTGAVVSVYVTDGNGQSSVPAQFSCTIT
jgi:hypothetical protein